MPTLLSNQYGVNGLTLLQVLIEQGLEAKLQSLCSKGGSIDAEGLTLTGVATLNSALPGEISFFTSLKYLQTLEHTQASLIITSERWVKNLTQLWMDKECAPCLLITPEPYLAFAKIAHHLLEYSKQILTHNQAIDKNNKSRIHASAIIAQLSKISSTAHIGALAVVEEGAQVGNRVTIGAGVYIGSQAIIGDDTVLHPRCTILEQVQIGQHCIIHSGAVIGSDGFGLAPNPRIAPGAWEKIPQLGRVIIGDHVEVGANTCIDRGALDDTILEQGVKLDNQIQVGHNVRIGAHTAVAGCVGIAGSAIIGKRCSLGGAAMILGHLQIADDVHISAASVVMSSIMEAGQYSGIFPLDTHQHWERNAAALKRLALLRKTVRAISQVQSLD